MPGQTTFLTAPLNRAILRYSVPGVANANLKQEIRSLSFSLQADSPPLHEDSDGALRVGSSRVLLELVIQSFQDGATPETIVQQYSALDLPDVYAVIAYYLRHRNEVEEYLVQREEKARSVRQTIELRQGNMSEIRQRLAARRQP